MPTNALLQERQLPDGRWLITDHGISVIGATPEAALCQLIRENPKFYGPSMVLMAGGDAKKARK